MQPYDLDRLQFAFTITFHYLFPQLTMGLALLIVVLKGMALKTGNPNYDRASRFWARLFAVNFVIGVVTGIPMEFQFGTNWAQFSRLTGGVIGQPLAMEGVFAFFLESAFLGLFLFGEKRMSKLAHFGAAFMVFAGSWTSGFFIIATNAWMQHPVAYTRLPNGDFQLKSFWDLFTNPWLWREYPHNMCATVITGAFVMAATGAFYVLSHRDEEFGRIFLRVAIIAGIISCAIQIFPTGDAQAKFVAHNQPPTTAAMEGLFNSKAGAPLIFMGQPNMQTQTIDNAFGINDVLSFLAYGTPRAVVPGLDAFPKKDWPTMVPLVYYSYHIMAGLGTYFVFIMGLAALLLWRRKLYDSWLTRPVLWALMLSFPLPYIATTAGWMTAETGRQPWLVYGLLRTSQGGSPLVSSGNSLFTLIGFMGMYSVLAILWIVLAYRIIEQGPGEPTMPEHAEAISA